MQDLNDKITGNELTADEWNEMPSEIQNIIEAMGITLSGGDLDQLGKGIAAYVGNGNHYLETAGNLGAPYILAVTGSRQPPTTYFDGMEIRFLASQGNIGDVTINVSNIGVVELVRTDETQFPLLTIDVFFPIQAFYNAALGKFVESPMANKGVTNKFQKSCEFVSGLIAIAGSQMSQVDFTGKARLRNASALQLQKADLNYLDVVEMLSDRIKMGHVDLPLDLQTTNGAFLSSLRAHTPRDLRKVTVRGFVKFDDNGVVEASYGITTVNKGSTGVYTIILGGTAANALEIIACATPENTPSSATAQCSYGVGNVVVHSFVGFSLSNTGCTVIIMDTGD